MSKYILLKDETKTLLNTVKGILLQKTPSSIMVSNSRIIFDALNLYKKQIENGG